ncbi:four-carbon acid sugar kinase family protein [Brevibacterium spongiae]|uniref:Four-carbon acid sugar kinase family protein n=1 Tax=Brevibacterium spongiae TaxID=2909672 RepID=A0ABY5SS06_9MICO|nr:four-carbon acid sugar kinase family protein [Brevibacterium spongiae]UVI37332.1 four-carbon acid sugar kinase family protein [Brevibacterium spongiae]
MPRPHATASAQASPRILIVADDLTGGNACGALFAEAGLRTITLSAAERSAGLSRFLDDYDAVVVNADSRHLPPREAADLTSGIIAAAGQVDLVACRIDTTLRGNVGPTAEAALRSHRTAPASAGGHRRHVVGLCVPAFPAAGRTTVQGQQLLGGRRLEDTELARDVRSPMHTSEVETILGEGTRLSCRRIEISTILSGPTAIREQLCEAIAAGADVVIADALTTEHIDLIGAVAAELTQEIADAPAGDDTVRALTGLHAGELLDWVTIDPGPGSLALARSLLPTRPQGVLLGISGSATEVTRSQLSALAEDPGVTLIRTVLDEENLPDVQATLARVEEAASARAIIVATVLDSHDLLELDDDESQRTTQRLARIAAAVVDSMTVTGLYTTGGDVTAEVMRALDAVGMAIDKEIIPLAVGGRLVGGAADGLPIVTKGGLIGDAGTAAQCLDHLSTASAQAHPSKGD